MENIPDSPFLDRTRRAENTIYENELRPLFKILNHEKREEHITADILFTEKQPSAEETKELFAQNIFRLSIGQSHGLKLHKDFIRSVAAKYFSHIHHIVVTIYFGEPMVFRDGSKTELKFAVRDSDPLGLREARIKEVAQFLKQCPKLETVTLVLEPEPYERHVATNTRADGFGAFPSIYWKDIISPLLIRLGVKKVFVYLDGDDTRERPEEIEMELQTLKYWLNKAMCRPRLQGGEAEFIRVIDPSKSSGKSPLDVKGKSMILRGFHKFSEWRKKQGLTRYPDLPRK